MSHPKIFVSYSHADSKRKDRLLQHLTPLEAAAEFDIWTDTQIGGGEVWEPAIEKALSGATLAILLITADFLSSDFIRHKEVPALLERREKEGLRLYPILARPCAWQAVPWLEQTQIRPVAAKPVWRSGGRYADDELTRIALELLALLQLAIQAQKSGSDQASREKAEQLKREKERAIAEVIAASPPVESIYQPLKTTSPFAAADPSEVSSASAEVDEFAGAARTRQIYGQIAADAAEQQAERWKLLQELQSKVFAIAQDASVNRSKSMDKAYKRWEEYIRS